VTPDHELEIGRPAQRPQASSLDNQGSKTHLYLKINSPRPPDPPHFCQSVDRAIAFMIYRSVACESARQRALNRPHKGLSCAYARESPSVMKPGELRSPIFPKSRRREPPKFTCAAQETTPSVTHHFIVIYFKYRST
jgi:hypothetical protein